jgi:hypothetical protein
MALSSIEIAIYAVAFLFPWVGFVVYVIATAPRRRAAEEARLAEEQRMASAEAQAKALAKRAKQRPWENIEVPKIATHQAKGHVPPVETPKLPFLTLFGTSLALCAASWVLITWQGDKINIRGTAVQQGPEMGAKKGVEVIRLGR